MTFPAELKAPFVALLQRKKIRCSNGWENYMETVSNPAALVVEIQTQAELVLVLKEIYTLNEDRKPEDKITVRATAGHSTNATCGSCMFPWNSVQEAEYSAGYSFSQVVGGRAQETLPGTDVIIRFAKKFHTINILSTNDAPLDIDSKNPIHQLPTALVEVSAGVQIAELATFLYKHHLSLSTVSMISWVTAVGLAGTGGHGTGRDEPAFSGLIESIKVIDLLGTVRELTPKNPDFTHLRGAHSGLLGVVISIQLRVVAAFNLKETIELFHDASAMHNKLSDILLNNHYVSIMGMPSPDCNATSAQVAKWQIRKWNHTSENPLRPAKASYEPDIQSFTQEIETRVGASVMGYLIDSGLQKLLPLYMVLSAAVVTTSRGEEPIVGHEHHITHPQVAFPKEMRDVSYLIPVDDGLAGEILENILLKIESLLNKAADQGDIPLTYAVYVRYFKGTYGGLSTSATSSNNERIIALDFVTHPAAPGIMNFEKNLLHYFREMKLQVRHHLGKNVPFSVNHYDEFLGTVAVSEYKSALTRWHDVPGQDIGEARLAMSPFITPYLQKMLTYAPSLSAELQLISEGEEMLAQTPLSNHRNDESLALLRLLHQQITLLKAEHPLVKAAKEDFLNACLAELKERSLVARECTRTL